MAPNKPSEAMESPSDEGSILFIKNVPAKSLEQRLDAVRTKLQGLKLSFKESGFNFKLQPHTPLPFPSTVNNEIRPPAQSTPDAAPVAVSNKSASRKRSVTRCDVKEPEVPRGQPLKRKRNLENDPEKKRKYFERIFRDDLRQARNNQMNLEEMRSLAANIPQLLDDQGKKVSRAEWRRVLKVLPVIPPPKSPATLERESSHVAAILAKYSNRRVSRRRYRDTDIMSDIPPPK